MDTHSSIGDASRFVNRHSGILCRVFTKSLQKGEKRGEKQEEGLIAERLQLYFFSFSGILNRGDCPRRMDRQTKREPAAERESPMRHTPAWK